MRTRREMIAAAGALTAAIVTAKAMPASAQDAPAKGASPGSKENGPFSLPKLPYDYAALEPHIDARTMELHHSKHHRDYVSKLNEAVAKGAKIDRDSPVTSGDLDSLLLQITLIDEPLRKDVKNNGGGHANHSMFWSIMAPGGGQQPSGKSAEAFSRTFGSIDNMKSAFNDAAENHFGAGWVFLTLDTARNRMEILTRPNQDSPLMDGKRVLFGNDLWEHAYYLKYENRKTEYLKSWWNVVNWQKIDRRYDAILAGDAVI